MAIVAKARHEPVATVHAPTRLEATIKAIAKALLVGGPLRVANAHPVEREAHGVVPLCAVGVPPLGGGASATEVPATLRASLLAKPLRVASVHALRHRTSRGDAGPDSGIKMA